MRPKAQRAVPLPAADSVALALAPSQGKGVARRAVSMVSADVLAQTVADLKALQVDAGLPHAPSLPVVPSCSLCGKQMTDPVVLTETGHTFDRLCIESWLAGNATCPVSGLELRHKQLADNFIMRDIINQGLRQGEKLEWTGIGAPVEQLMAPAPAIPTRQPSLEAPEPAQDEVRWATMSFLLFFISQGGALPCRQGGLRRQQGEACVCMVGWRRGCRCCGALS